MERYRLHTLVAFIIGIMLTIGFLLAGCGSSPEWHKNTLVLHVVANECYDTDLELLLESSNYVWETLEQLEDCRNPLRGHAWAGDVLQVWVSEANWQEDESLKVIMGRAQDEPSSWAVGHNDHLRIDHSHVFIGTLDIAGEQPKFFRAQSIGLAVDRLADRQDWKRRPWGYGEEWEHADLYNFQAGKEYRLVPHVTEPEESDAPTEPYKKRDKRRMRVMLRDTNFVTGGTAPALISTTVAATPRVATAQNSAEANNLSQDPSESAPTAAADRALS